MGIIILPIIFVIFVLSFIPSFILIVSFKSSYAQYFKYKKRIIFHFIIVVAVTYLGLLLGVAIVEINSPSSFNGFNGYVSFILFIIGVFIPGLFCYLSNIIQFLIYNNFSNLNLKKNKLFNYQVCINTQFAIYFCRIDLKMT